MDRVHHNLSEKVSDKFTDLFQRFNKIFTVEYSKYMHNITLKY